MIHSGSRPASGLELQFEPIYCKSHLCILHIPSILFLRTHVRPTVYCTLCSLLFFLLTHFIIQVFSCFISFHSSVLPCLIDHQQDEKKKEKVTYSKHAAPALVEYLRLLLLFLSQLLCVIQIGP